MASDTVDRLVWLAGVCAEGARRHGTDARQVRAFIDRRLAELPAPEREALDIAVRRALTPALASESRH